MRIARSQTRAIPHNREVVYNRVKCCHANYGRNSPRPWRMANCAQIQRHLTVSKKRLASNRNLAEAISRSGCCDRAWTQFGRYRARSKISTGCIRDP